jgi:hypothetical protein
MPTATRVWSARIYSMASSLASLLAKTRDQLGRERMVRAQGAAPAGISASHFAAVMGNAVRAELAESEEWQVNEHFDSDSDFRFWRQKVQAAIGSDALAGRRNPLEGLLEAVEKSVVGVLWQARGNLLSSLHDLTSSPSDSEDVSTDSGTGTGSRTSSGTDRGSVDKETGATDASLIELEEFLNAREAGKSASRIALQTTYKEQVAFIAARASELQFVQKAIIEVGSENSELKRSWSKPTKDYFSDPKVVDNEKHLEIMTKEQARTESKLQRYFDCASQGATSLGSSEKSEKVKLTIATELESHQAGYRQIQLVDLYCLNRGSTMWAIIPDLYRVGHDIDPIATLHWRSNILGLPEQVRPYYAEQNAAFAKKLLAQCSTGFRTTLLGEHKYGTKKEAFRAEKDDGVSLYWVMVQLYHPTGRERRRTLE